MFITKKHIPRRTFLQGAGATVALPLLEAMLPAQTPQRETAASPDKIRRFVGVWYPHGAAPGYWSPLQEGKDFEFSFITKPLEPFRDRVVLITGLDATAAAPTAPLGSTSSFIRINRNLTAARISSSLTRTTDST